MEILRDLSPNALGRAVEENASSLWPSWAVWEGVRYEARDRWRRISSSVPHPAFNHLYHLTLETGASRAILAEALGAFRERRLPCLCWIDPVTAHRYRRDLEGAGLEFLFAAPGMAVTLDGVGSAGWGPEGLTVEEVDSRGGLAEWCRIVSEASDFPPPAAAAWRQLHERIPFGAGKARRHFLGRYEGAPVGTSSLFLTAGVAGLYSVTVLPAHRRRGAGTALSLAALEAARREGYGAAVLVSTSAGIGIYRRLGFREYRRWECWCLEVS